MTVGDRINEYYVSHFPTVAEVVAVKARSGQVRLLRRMAGCYAIESHWTRTT
jgi:hypothetical protein